MKYCVLTSVVAWFAILTVVEANDKLAIEALEKAGAFVQRDETQKEQPVVLVKFNLLDLSEAGNQALNDIEQLPAIEFTGAGASEIDVATLRALQGKASLKRLTLSYAKLNDESAKVLGTLKNIEALVLRVQVQMSPRGFEEIAKMTHLKELTVSDRLATDDNLDHLTRLSGLKVLEIKSVFVTDFGLAALQRMPNLKTLRIFLGDEVTVKGVAKLAEMSVKELEITYFNVKLPALKELRKINGLKTLRLLNAVNVTDEAIPILSELRELKELEIVGVKLTKNGLKELKAALPDCKITERSL